MKIYKLVITAMCVALGLVLPMAFHAIQNAGSIFLPMHIPVLLCGLLVGSEYGLICGILAPFLSSILTGMPPGSILPSMMIELAVYGFVGGVCMKHIPMKSEIGKTYVSLIVAMLAGRLVSGISKAMIFNAGSFTMKAFVMSSFVTALPGIVIQLILLPMLVTILKKVSVLHER